MNHAIQQKLLHSSTDLHSPVAASLIWSKPFQNGLLQGIGFNAAEAVDELAIAVQEEGGGGFNLHVNLLGQGGLQRDGHEREAYMPK